MPGETLRWGILGTGHIVHDFLQAMQKGERNHQVVAIGASSLERSQKFASENGYKCKTYGSYLEVLEDSEVGMCNYFCVLRLLSYLCEF